MERKNRRQIGIFVLRYGIVEVGIGLVVKEYLN
jgi:hypothetical protein